MTNSTGKCNCSIINGPSKGALIDALKYACDREYPRCATFTVKLNDNVTITREVRITTLGLEDGSGLRFNFEGYLKYPEGRETRAKGYYNTADNTGYFRVDGDSC